MDTTSVWQAIGAISVGDLAAWIAVIVAIIAFICAGAIKLYKIFEKYKKLKDDDKAKTNLLVKHDKILDEIDLSLKGIQKSLDEQKEVNLKQLRYSIVHVCEKALAENQISAAKLKTLEEMFEEYTDIFHANGYVKTLVEKARTLPVIGKLD